MNKRVLIFAVLAGLVLHTAANAAYTDEESVRVDDARRMFDGKQSIGCTDHSLASISQAIRLSPRSWEAEKYRSAGKPTFAVPPTGSGGSYGEHSPLRRMMSGWVSERP